MARTITIGAGYEGELLVFRLGAITIAAEQAFQASLGELEGLPPQEKGREQTRVCIDAIARWSTSRPIRRVRISETGEVRETDSGDPDHSIFDAVQAVFAELDEIDAERIANRVIFEFRLAMQPEVVFH